jgi:hypothetical protein
MVGWKLLDKINVHREYNTCFLTATWLHVCGSWKITKENKNWKIMQCPPIKSPPLSYGCDQYGLMFFFMLWSFSNCVHFHFAWGFIVLLFLMHLVLEGNNLAPWFFHACCLASSCNDVVHMKFMPTSLTIGV